MNKKIKLTIITAAMLIASLLSACTDEPCANACGMTDPHNSVVQQAVDWAQDTAPNPNTILP